MLSSLKRTCTVIARNYMMVQCLSRQSLKKIELNAPNVFNELTERLNDYDDPDI